MKKSILLLLSIMINLLWGECSLTLANQGITPEILDYKSKANISMSVTNTSSREIPALTDDNATCQVNIDLKLLSLVDNNVSLILSTSELDEYFDIIYIANNDEITLIQKANIPAEWNTTLTIPSEVLGQSKESDPLNGFMSYIVNTEEEISQYTYTNEAILIANNDINNSVPIISSTGSIIFDITSNDTINGVNAILAEDINITSIENNTSLIIDSNTGKVTLPEDIVEGIYTASYTICETFNTSNCSTGNIEINVTSTNLPDYELVLEVSPSVITQESVSLSILLQITEYDYGQNNGDLIIFLSKISEADLMFNPTLSTLSGRTLSNSEWEYSETPVGIQLKYIANDGNFTEHTRLYIGIEGMFNSPSNVVGKLPINVEILDGSGDSDNTNNTDADTISHSFIVN